MHSYSIVDTITTVQLPVTSKFTNLFSSPFESALPCVHFKSVRIYRMKIKKKIVTLALNRTFNLRSLVRSESASRESSNCIVLYCNVYTIYMYVYIFIWMHPIIPI